MLRLPRNLHMDVHKVLHLPRNLHMELHKVLRLPRNLDMEVHKALCLPRNLRVDVHRSAACAKTSNHQWRFTKCSDHATKSAHGRSQTVAAPASKSAERRGCTKCFASHRNLHFKKQVNTLIFTKCCACYRNLPKRRFTSIAPATKSAPGGSQSAVPATKSAHGGSQSAAPATKSALQETSENSNHKGVTIATMPRNHDPRMTRDPSFHKARLCLLRSHLSSIEKYTISCVRYLSKTHFVVRLP